MPALYLIPPMTIVHPGNGCASGWPGLASWMRCLWMREKRRWKMAHRSLSLPVRPALAGLSWTLLSVQMLPTEELKRERRLEAE